MDVLEEKLKEKAQPMSRCNLDAEWQSRAIKSGISREYFRIMKEIYHEEGIVEVLKFNIEYLFHRVTRWDFN